MAITRKDLNRIAEGFKYVADDPTADHASVVKMITEFMNAAESINPRFSRQMFVMAVFGPGHMVLNPWNNEPIYCGACGFDLFYDKGRSLDKFNHECARCFHINHTLTETGMSA